MRIGAPLRITPAAAASGVCLTLGLLPSLWVSWQAPVARGVVLPTLAILTLALLLPREEDDPGAKDARRQREPSPGFAAFLPVMEAGLLSVKHALTGLLAYPALLYLMWGAICAARVGLLSGHGGAGHMPEAADFARGELLRLMAGVALYLVMATTARHWEQARRSVDTLLWAVIVATVVAFVTHRAEDPALVGPFGNPQILAAVLLLLTPLAVVVATTARDRRRRTVGQVAAILGLAALALAQTRSAWLGGLVALITLAGLLARLPRRRRRWNRQPPLHRAHDHGGAGAPTLVAAMLALGALGWLVCHTDFSGPVAARAATLTRLSDDEGAVWRLRQWRVALSLVHERPLAGHGLGMYPLAAAPRLPHPIPLSVARAIGPNLALNAHNLYLQTLAETGAVGLGLYLWTLITFFAAGLRACRRRDYPFRSLVLVACMAGVAGQVVDALANPAYQFADASLFFWALLGLGAAMAQRPPRPVDPAPGEEAAAGLARADDASAGSSAGGSTPADPFSQRPVPYPLRLAAALAGAGVLAAGSVAGAPPPLNQASYLPLRTFRVQALTQPGYLVQSLLPGECVEMRGLGTLFSGEEQDATGETVFTRAGGTAPADALAQLPPPHANLFCVPTGVPATDDGLTVALQGTFSFNGQTLSATGPLLSLSVPRAAPGVQVNAEPRVIPPTGDMTQIEVRYDPGDMHFERLQKVDANEPLADGDVRILDPTHILLRATSSTPDQRIYTLHYRFRDRRNESWVVPVQIYVR